MNKLKIAVYTGSYPDTTFLTLLTRGLVSKNLEVHVYGRLIYKSLKDKGIKFYTFSSKLKVFEILFCLKYLLLNFLFNFSKTLLFFKSIKHESRYKKYKKSLVLLPILFHKPDVIHLQWIHSYVIFKNTESFITAKIIVSIRGRQLSISSFINPELKQLTIEATNRAIKIHSISDDLSNQLLQINPNVANKIVKINPAIDLNLFSVSEQFMKQDKKSPIRIISVCRLSWKKGLIYGIMALKEIKESGIDFEYVIVGEGEQYEELVHNINDLGLSSMIQLVGKLSQEEIKKHLRNADVFLLPSVQEGFSNAVIEAQAMGLPCLVSNAEGLEENIESGKTGFVFRKKDVRDLVRVITDFNNLSSCDYLRMKQNAVNRCQVKYDVKIQIQKFKDLYTYAL
jgi:colanic acid/amylovoran biosynthesis glycosyltransferase